MITSFFVETENFDGETGDRTYGTMSIPTDNPANLSLKNGNLLL